MKIFNSINILVTIVFLSKIIYTGEINLMIHPRYFWLIYLSIFVLGILFFGTIKENFQKKKTNKINLLIFSLFILGLFFNFSPLSSANQQQNTQENIINTNQISRQKINPNFSTETENLSLEELVGIFTLDPEPNNYIGNKVNVEGFYFETSDGSPMIAKHLISCCAADARIIGIWLNENLEIEQDQWISITGELTTLEENDRRLIAIKITEYQKIETPKDPYAR